MEVNFWYNIAGLDELEEERIKKAYYNNYLQHLRDKSNPFLIPTETFQELYRYILRFHFTLKFAIVIIEI